MPGGNSARRKGKGGEREVARALGGERNLAQSRAGGVDVLDPLRQFGIEVKRRKRLLVARWMEYAVQHAPSDSMPIVCMREDRGEWLVLIRLTDYELLRAAYNAYHRPKAHSAEEPHA